MRYPNICLEGLRKTRKETEVAIVIVSAEISDTAQTRRFLASVDLPGSVNVYRVSLINGIKMIQVVEDAKMSILR
jgi:hypothetical protein